MEQRRGDALAAVFQQVGGLIAQEVSDRAHAFLLTFIITNEIPGAGNQRRRFSL
jgi:hypothetical protein